MKESKWESGKDSAFASSLDSGGAVEERGRILEKHKNLLKSLEVIRGLV